MIGLGPNLNHLPWHEKLRRVLDRSQGARLGESTVVSRQVHMSDPQLPHLVTILTGSDAGQVFYGRSQAGEIIHLDIFHALGEVDHVRVANALRWALAGIQLDSGDGGPLVDFFDLMTGTGGGRVSGTLRYGQGASLRAAHRNHVHLAGRLPEQQLHLLIPMVSAVETEIRALGVEIRRVEQLAHGKDGGSGQPLDLSHYTDQNDTRLRGQGGSPKAAGARDGRAAEGSAAPGSGGSLRGQRGQGGSSSGQWEPGGPGNAQPGAGGGGRGATPGCAGFGGESEGTADPGDGARCEQGRAEPSAWDQLEQERRLQAALELSRRLGSPDEVKRILDELRGDGGWSSLYASGSSQAPYIVRQLEDEGLVRRDLRGLRLTESGAELARYLDAHLRDIKLRFRKLIRRLPASGAAVRRKPGPARSRPCPEVRWGPVRGSAPLHARERMGDIAVPETVRAALRRTLQESVGRDGARALDGAPDHGDERRPRLRVTRPDIHVQLRSGEAPLHVCLLIDASASMAGRRILAAKHLVRHLLVSTRDRIAVIGFQERDVRVYVPFTRDWNQVEAGLARIQPLGLTPLAHGLTQSLELIRDSRVRRPLLLLITDGIPTVPLWSIDPLTDALEAARLVGEARVPFGCIGLQPSRRYLEEMVKKGAGTLHVVDELDEEALVRIAHQERSKLAVRVR